MQRALSVSRMTGNTSTFPDWYQAIVREADLAFLFSPRRLNTSRASPRKWRWSPTTG